MKRYALIFLAAIFLPSLVLGWLALRTAGEQRVLIEGQAADLHQAETDALAAKVRQLIEDKQHAFDEIVRALVSERDASALAHDYGDQLLRFWLEGGIPFAISPTGSLAFPTPHQARQNRAFEEFLWYNSAFLTNETVAEIYQVQPGSSPKGNPELEKAGSGAQADLANSATRESPLPGKTKRSKHSAAKTRLRSTPDALLKSCSGAIGFSNGGRRRCQWCPLTIRSE